MSHRPELVGTPDARHRGKSLCGLPLPTHLNAPRTDVECEFELDEHQRVWIILEGDCRIIGRKEVVRKEMWRFLRLLLPGMA